LQGYVLDIKGSREEDLIVNVLTSDSLRVLYRFYGARHSSINIGYKIDFEQEDSDSYLPRMRNISHINFLWIEQRDTFFAWQKFSKYMFFHLRQTTNLPHFYFDMLENINSSLENQNYKRAIIESFISMQKFEGSIGDKMVCATCGEEISSLFVIDKQLIPYHSACSIGFMEFDSKEMSSLFERENSFSVSDENIDRLYNFLF